MMKRTTRECRECRQHDDNHSIVCSSASRTHRTQRPCSVTNYISDFCFSSCRNLWKCNWNSTPLTGSLLLAYTFEPTKYKSQEPPHIAHTIYTYLCAFAVVNAFVFLPFLCRRRDKLSRVWNERTNILCLINKLDSIHTQIDTERWDRGGAWMVLGREVEAYRTDIIHNEFLFEWRIWRLDECECNENL